MQGTAPQRTEEKNGSGLKRFAKQIDEFVSRPVNPVLPVNTKNFQITLLYLLRSRATRHFLALCLQETVVASVKGHNQGFAYLARATSVPGIRGPPGVGCDHGV